MTRTVRFTVEFGKQEGSFQALDAARDWLRRQGYSAGIATIGSPVAVKRGQHHLGAWRDMDGSAVEQLDGVLRGNIVNGPLTLEIFADEPLAAIQAMTVEQLEAEQRRLRRQEGYGKSVAGQRQLEAIDIALSRKRTAHACTMDCGDCAGCAPVNLCRDCGRAGRDCSIGAPGVNACVEYRSIQSVAV